MSGRGGKEEEEKSHTKRLPVPFEFSYRGQNEVKLLVLAAERIGRRLTYPTADLAWCRRVHVGLRFVLR